ncbi:MAG: transglycosylase SLT domain-containing protein [Bacteroidales bacterium]|nr:transglycosylase SLT domain-containing protein [Bacteroidales bacterium]
MKYFIKIFPLILFAAITNSALSVQDSTHRNETVFKDKVIRQTPDLVYEYRLASLNMTTPVELDFNEEVKRYIEVYLGPRKAELERIIGLSKLFFPVFDEVLDRYGLPLELKYLTIVESGLDPLATSRSGAAGLWQFLFNTGELFELKVTSYIDERRDPYKSTEAACKYLSYLYNTFYDWLLVLSSYNGGPGEVRKAIERNNGETGYWKIRPALSEQAKNYVPAFIAVLYVMNFYKEHDIVPVEPEYDYFKLDTLHLDYAVSFEQIEAMIGLPVGQIRYLNPMYKRDYIPKAEPWSVLVLPAEKIPVYLRNENQIIGYTSVPVDYHLMIKNGADTTGKAQLIHEVQPGEYTHKIALQYNCTIENIKAWNNLNDYNIVPGQKLVIWLDRDN